MTTFNAWAHPTTGAVRVYIGGFGSTKVWAESCADHNFGFDYKIKAFNANRNHSEIDNIINEAERAIFTAAGRRVKQFEQVIELAD